MEASAKSSESSPTAVSQERIRQLLAEEGESAALEYKRELHPASRRELVKVAKHIGAMSAAGGDILIGVGERGEPTGLLTERDAELFDEAVLRDKLRPYLPPRTRFRTAVHEMGGHHVALVAVDPHPLGICVMVGDGNYDGGCEFHAGDVFVRRGTQSVRWSEAEVHAFVERTRHGQREQVRSEVRAEWEAHYRLLGGAETVSKAPLVATSWALDLDTLVNSVAEEIRGGDEAALRRLLVSLPREVAELAGQARGIERTAEVLDRCAGLLGEFVVSGRADLLQLTLRRLRAAYEGALEDPSPASAVPGPVLGLMIVERLHAVGALAVRLQEWDVVRTIAVTQVRASCRGVPYLLPYVQRQAEARDLLKVVDGGRARHVWLLSRAADLAAGNRWLVPDVLPHDERLVTSLCQFDFLAAVAMASDQGGPDPALVQGNFAGWFSNRTDPLARGLISEDPDLRQAIFPGGDEDLAAVLHVIADRGLNRWGLMTPPWDGYDERSILDWLRENLATAAP